MKNYLLAVLLFCSGCSGCTFGERVVSAVGVSAVTVDRIAQADYETREALVLATARRDGETFAWYCAEMQVIWDDVAPLQCAAVALAELALAGDELIKSGSALDGDWLGHACGAVTAAVTAFEAADKDVPPAIASAADLLCGSATAIPPDLDCMAPVVPGCEEVSP